MSEPDDELDELIERSSLGSAGARALRRQTPRGEVSRVRRLAALRKAVVFGPGDARTLTSLILLYRELEYEADLIAVWRFVCADPRRRPYAAETLRSLAPEVAARLLDVTQRDTGVQLLTALAPDEAAGLLRHMADHAALSCVAAMPEADAELLLSRFVRQLPAAEVSVWLRATTAGVAARVLRSQFLRDRPRDKNSLAFLDGVRAVAEILEEMDVPDCLPILLELGRTEKVADFLDQMLKPSRVADRMSYSMALRCLLTGPTHFWGWGGDPRRGKALFALQMRVAVLLSRKSMKETLDELEMIRRQDPTTASNLRRRLAALFGSV